MLDLKECRSRWQSIPRALRRTRQDPKPKPPAGRVIARHQGKRLIVLSGAAAAGEAKVADSLKLPEAIEAIAEKTRVARRAAVRGLASCSQARPSSAQARQRILEDSEVRIIQRGQLAPPGALGLVAGDLVFEVDDFRLCKHPRQAIRRRAGRLDKTQSHKDRPRQFRRSSRSWLPPRMSGLSHLTHFCGRRLLTSITSRHSRSNAPSPHGSSTA